MSPRYSLNSADLKKIATGLGIAVAGAALTYLEQLIPSIDFGVYAPLAVSVNSVLVNLARKWLQSK